MDLSNGREKTKRGNIDQVDALLELVAQTCHISLVQPPNRLDYRAWHPRQLADFYGGAWPDQSGQANGVPVSKADAARAAGAADSFRIGGAMEADAGLTEAAPEDPDGAIRAGWYVECLGVGAAFSGV